MQAGYWIRHRLHVVPPRLRNALLGYILLFAGRMAFVLATSIFGFVFITGSPGLHIPLSRYVVIMIGLFALFCYTQELDRLGKALIGPD